MTARDWTKHTRDEADQTGSNDANQGEIKWRNNIMYGMEFLQSDDANGRQNRAVQRHNAGNEMLLRV
jgi:hypothetical protein